jgi:hypothetical protein
MTISVRDVLTILGFDEDWQTVADEQPAYRLDLGNLNINAAQVTGRWFRPMFLITGTERSSRTLRMIQCELPLEVESFEQGVALIVRAVGYEYQPEKPVPWFELGKRWRDRLPPILR